MNGKSKIALWASVAIGLTAIALGGMKTSTAQAGTVMHVTDLAISKHFVGFRGQPPAFVAVMYIRDQSGNPVAGAVVTGDFGGCFTKPGASARTDRNGQAKVIGDKVDCATTGPCDVTFVVTDVVKSGAAWNGVSATASSPGCR